MSLRFRQRPLSGQWLTRTSRWLFVSLILTIPPAFTMPTIDVQLPTAEMAAQVGSISDARKFMVRALVSDDSPGGIDVEELTIADFHASINGVNAPITAVGFIVGQHWLVVQAPVQVSVGDYDLRLRLRQPGSLSVVATDISANSVVYGSDGADHLLVLDRSGSMNRDGKFVAAQNAANFYIDLVRNNDGLAVVPFHTDVNPTPYSIRRVTTVPNVRASAENYVDGLSTGNLTSIGDGLFETVSQRIASPTSHTRCSITLVSDGLESAGLYWGGVRNQVIAAGCPVQAVAFGSASDETLMQDIATETGGRYFSTLPFGSGGASNSLADANLALGDVYEYAHSQAVGHVRMLRERGAVPEFQSEFELPPDQIHQVFIDPTVTEAVFSLDWHSINEPDCDNPQVSNGCFGKDLALKLMGPSGQMIDPEQLNYTFEDIVSGHVGWRIANPEPGEWTLVVNADSFYVGYDLEYQVIVSGTSAVTAELPLSDQIGTRYNTGDYVPIHAFFSSDQPIGGTSVVAQVTAPNGRVASVVLFDDGKHDDGGVGDGFYVGLYTQVNQASRVTDLTGEDGSQLFREALDEGSYQVRLLANSGDLAREVLGGFSVQEGPDENLNGVPDNYERVHDIGSVTEDADLDGLDAASEYQLGTYPNDSDSDGGGENDGSEFNKGQNQLHARDDMIVPPGYLVYIPRAGFNEIDYDVKPEYDRRILYRATGPDGPWILRNTELSSAGRDIDDTDPGQTYFYRYLAIDAEQHGSAIIDGVPGTDPEVIFESGFEG